MPQTASQVSAASRNRFRRWSREFVPATDFPRLGVPDDVARDSAGERSKETKRAKAAMGVNPNHPHPATGDPDYSAEETAFLKALLEWRTRAHKTFPTNTELLGILRGMGYVRVPHGFKLVQVSPHEMAVIADSMDAPGVTPALRVVSPDDISM